MLGLALFSDFPHTFKFISGPLGLSGSSKKDLFFFVNFAQRVAKERSVLIRHVLTQAHLPVSGELHEAFSIVISRINKA